MNFDEAVPKIEAKLYAWAEQGKHRPSAPVSQYFALVRELHEVGIISRGTPENTSPQERHVERWGDFDADAAVIEDVLAQVDRQQRRLVGLRYVQGLPWARVAHLMRIHRQEVYVVRDRVINVLAVRFGLLNGNGAA